MICKLCRGTRLTRLSCTDMDNGICKKCKVDINNGNYDFVITNADEIFDNESLIKREITQQSMDDSLVIADSKDSSNVNLIPFTPLKQKDVIVAKENMEFPLAMTYDNVDIITSLKQQITKLSQQVTLLSQKVNERHYCNKHIEFIEYVEG